jgi:RNA polymerase sigma-70 factor (ECF subfamily)
VKDLFVKEDAGQSDEILAARAATGDRAAFETIVRRHKEPIFRFVRRYVGNSDDAYDLLQDAFLAAWSGLPRYDSARPFLPWLRTIALNKCRDFSRRQSVRRLFLKALAARPEEKFEPAEAGQEDRLDRLDAAIATLPAFYKEALLLTTVSGLSHHATAEILKTTPKAIEMRLYRARRKILAAIGETEAEPGRGI